MPFPEIVDWDLPETRVHDLDRVTRLLAPSSPPLLELIPMALKEAWATTRLGWEVGDDAPDHPRAVVQFPVAPELFDTFMNGRTGYRAAYSVSQGNGQAYNTDLVAGLVRVLQAAAPPLIQAQSIGPGFSVTGIVEVPRDAFLRSLEATLTKIWMATVLIGEQRELPLGIDTPKIAVSNRTPWATIVRDASSSWLDVKGGFLGSDGPYQVKPTSNRNQRLWERGEA
jgi:hypothetical protein